MPVQTNTVYGYIKVKDGCKLEAKSATDPDYVDLGEIDNQDISLPVQFTEIIRQTGNRGRSAPLWRDFIVEGNVNLTDLNPETYKRLSGGVITGVTTTASPVATLDNQVIAANWTADTPIQLDVIDSVSGVEYNCTALTLTSVTGDVSGAGTAGSDYDLIITPETRSGYSIVLKTGGLATFATSEVITIVFASATPVASTTLYCGTSTYEPTPVALRFTHTDSAGSIDWQLELYTTYARPGAFAFNFGSQGSDGVDTLPFQFRAQIDTTKTDGRQLLSCFVKAAA